MQKKIVTVFLVLCCFLVLGQTRFSKAHPNIGGAPGPPILVTDSGYISISRYVYSNTLVDFMKLDKAGMLTMMRSGSDTTVLITENGDKCLHELGEDYFLAQYKLVTSDSGFVTFLHLDQNFDTIKIKNHIGYEGYSPLIRAMEFDTDTTFIVSGNLYRNTGSRNKYDFWAARVDTAFNVLWQQRVEDNRPSINGGYTGLDIVVDAYGSILVTGAYGVTNAWSSEAVNRSFAARLNQKTGNVYWLKEYRRPETDYDSGASYMFALDEGNGTYSFIDAQYFHFGSGSSTYPDSSQLRFGYMDTMGIILWDTLLGPTVQRYEPRDLHKTVSGNYYTAGLIAVPSLFKSFGFVFSSQGDSIHYIIHRHKDSVEQEDALIRENLWNFQPTPDGGFIHIGNWVNPDTMQNIVHTWLLKTDEYGCKIEGCEIGLKEDLYKAGVLKLYPNPSNGEVYIESSQDYEGRRITFSVVDMRGLLVYQKTEEALFRNKLELGYLPKGLYMVRARLDDEILGAAKLLIYEDY